MEHNHNVPGLPGFLLMVLLSVCGILVDAVQAISAIAPLLQIAAYCTTIYVGYRTVKNMKK